MTAMNASLHLHQYGLDREQQFLTDEIAAAIRALDGDRVMQLSPVAGCLLPLLKFMHLENRRSELIQSLPFAKNSFDLDDLRNVLINLGIDSTREKLKEADIHASMLPCLLSDELGNLLVVTDRTADGYDVFDANNASTYRVVQLPTGVTAYFFTDIRTISEHINPSAELWMSRLLHRFYPLFGNIIILTLLINVIAVTPPLFIMLVYDLVIGSHFQEALIFLAAGIAIILAVEFILRWIRAHAIGRFAARIDYLVSIESFRHIMQVSPFVIERSDLWSQMNMVRQFDGIRELLSGTNASLFVEIPFLFISILVIALIGGPLAFVPIVAVLLTFGLALLWHLSIGNLEASGNRSGFVTNQMTLETLHGVKDIKGIGIESEWREKFRGASALSILDRRQKFSLQNFYATASHLIGVASAIVILWWGTHRIIDDHLSVGALIAIMILIWRVNAPMHGLLMLTPRLRPITRSIALINRLMTVPQEFRSPAASHLVANFSGKLAFANVSFNYENSARPALLNINFELAAGELVAVTGNSGSGKSTLLKLICRMYTNRAGAILIDDLDLRQIDPVTLRQTISYLPHDPHLFYGSIAENIRYNQPEATDTELHDAAEEAGILDQINSLPKGFETLVSDQLSEQLPSSLVYGICLARTFVRKCPIMLLDEPGSNLDFNADQRLIKNLNNRRGKQTIIITTHRPSHIALATRVLELNNGMLVNRNE